MYIIVINSEIFFVLSIFFQKFILIKKKIKFIYLIYVSMGIIYRNYNLYLGK